MQTKRETTNGVSHLCLGTWRGQWQTMFGSKVIDRGNDDLMLTFHDIGTITGGATDPRNGSFKVTGTWRRDGKVKFTYSNPGNGNDGETAHGQVKGNRMETDWTNRHCSGKAQYEYDQVLFRRYQLIGRKKYKRIWRGERRSEWKLRIRAGESIQIEYLGPKLAITNTQIILQYSLLFKTVVDYITNLSGTNG